MGVSRIVRLSNTVLGIRIEIVPYRPGEGSASAIIQHAVAVAVFALGFVAVGSAADATRPTFTEEVAPILFKNCVKCHRPGEIASTVPLLSYETARPWATAIKQKVEAREMPPWPADPNRSLKFRNDARLSRQDINTLVAWANAGAPKGNDADLPPVPKFAHGWLHPQGVEPDLVISLPGEFQAPAHGEIPYVRFLVKVPFLEDKWIVASQARPGNAALVHHMAITEIELADRVAGMSDAELGVLARLLGFPGDLTRARTMGARNAVTDASNPAVFDMLGMYTPGTTFESYGDDSAKLLKGGKNMYFNFNIHYQTTGKPEKDRSMMAFWFQPKPPKHQLFRVPAAAETIIANGRELLTDAPGTKAEGTQVAIPPIPPYADNYELIAVTGYVEPVTMYQFQPHAHYRGKDFKYTVVYPDGREEPVLNVPKYDFRWQLAYELETPLKLPAGSKLIVTAHYDNSLKKEHNPAPQKEVYFRDQNQSWDEMFSPFIQYTIDNQDLTKRAEPGGQPEQPEQSAVEIAEVVGCLQRSPVGEWMLTNAGDPSASRTQPTSSAALMAAAGRPLGNGRYRLLGVSVFNPLSDQGEKVAVKGILIKNTKESRLNVTSLQPAGAGCIN